MTPTSEYTARVAAAAPTDWLSRGVLLWQYRRTLARVTGIAMVVSLGIACVIPKQYKSVASIMPPDQQGGSSAMLLAALAGRSGSLGSLGSLAGGLLGTHTSTALYESLLESGTIGGRLIDRFNLQKVYHSRYRFTTAKHLARMTKISDDKKSGVITIAVEDTDPVRARDLAQAYLDELNNLLTRTSSSSARQERIFIESRLHSVSADLEQAQLALSEFSSKNSTIDLKEQTRGLVDAGARVQGELLVEQSGLQSLRQIYGDGNVRVRETEARHRIAAAGPAEDGGHLCPFSCDGHGCWPRRDRCRRERVSLSALETASPSCGSVCGPVSPRACPGDHIRTTDAAVRDGSH